MSESYEENEFFVDSSEAEAKPTEADLLSYLKKIAKSTSSLGAKVLGWTLEPPEDLSPRQICHLVSKVHQQVIQLQLLSSAETHLAETRACLKELREMERKTPGQEQEFAQYQFALEQLVTRMAVLRQDAEDPKNGGWVQEEAEAIRVELKKLMAKLIILCPPQSTSHPTTEDSEAPKNLAD